MKNWINEIKTWNHFLLLVSMVCFLLGMILLIPLIQGSVPLWSVGAACLQMLGCGAVCLWGSWLHRAYVEDSKE